MSSSQLDEYRLLIAEVYELAGASRRGSERIARRHGLTAARWHVMSVVSDQSFSVSAIARRLGLARQSVQRVVDDLASTGHVTFAPDPLDRRAPQVSLTPVGKNSTAQLFATSDANREAVLARAATSAEDLNHAACTLRALLDALHYEGDSSSPA